MDELATLRPVDRRRDAARIGAGLLAFAVTIVWFRTQLAAVWPLVWPPTDPQAATLALVVALSLLLPVMVTASLVDIFYDRVLEA
ncbi:MAG: hypothetical protein ACI8UR_000290 [Natronomonas sp.]|jgi:hypothetical protein|uniref:hypothetical protein n=1 Tax=Natronomonas sp. TaxID=2184060 RepID=UPI003989BD16